MLADPNQHPELDGGGMVRGTRGQGTPDRRHRPGHHHEHAPGRPGRLPDDQHRDGLRAGSRIGWGPAMDPDCDAAKNFEGVDVSGHTYTWDLHEADGRTEVTETYEWTGVKDPQFEKLFPLVSQEDLERSLDKLAAAVSSQPARAGRRGSAAGAEHHPGAGDERPGGGGQHRVELSARSSGRSSASCPSRSTRSSRAARSVGSRPGSRQQRRGPGRADQGGGVVVGHRDRAERTVPEQLGGHPGQPERQQRAEGRVVVDLQHAGTPLGGHPLHVDRVLAGERRTAPRAPAGRPVSVTMSRRTPTRSARWCQRSPTALTATG